MFYRTKNERTLLNPCGTNADVNLKFIIPNKTFIYKYVESQRICYNQYYPSDEPLYKVELNRRFPSSIPLISEKEASKISLFSHMSYSTKLVLMWLQVFVQFISLLIVFSIKGSRYDLYYSYVSRMMVL